MYSVVATKIPFYTFFLIHREQHESILKLPHNMISDNELVFHNKNKYLIRNTTGLVSAVMLYMPEVD